MRREAGLSVSRFCELAGVPRSTWYRHAKKAREGQPERGPWRAPVRDRIEQPAAQLALEWPAWGHRKIHALLALDGFQASEATVRRALARRELLQPAGYQRERRQLAKARKAAFVVAPTRRNRVWQTDFSELETLAGGTWQLGGVVDYVAKLSLACPVTATKTWREAVAALEDARIAAEELLGHPLIDDLACPETGEIVKIIIVTDNGPCATGQPGSHAISPQGPSGNGGLIWPHCGGLNWPHLRPTGSRLFDAHRARAGGGGRNGITSGDVRADQERPGSGGFVDPGVGGASWRSSPGGAPSAGCAVASGEA